MPIAPSTYYAVKAQHADAGPRTARARRDAARGEAIQQLWDDNYRVYGARKVGYNGVATTGKSPAVRLNA